MTKWYKVLPKGFVCLVAVLMVLSALAVPSRDARSDEPNPCEGIECPEGELCVDGVCVPVAPIDCSMASCVFKDGTVGCTKICAGKDCTGGPPNGKCSTNFQTKGCSCQ